MDSSPNNQPVVIQSVTRAYFVLGAICLWNLNGITALAFGQNRILSIVILLLGIYIINVARETYMVAMGRPGMWFTIAILVYLGIGASSRLDISLVISHVNSVFLVFATAVGTRYIALRRGLGSLMTIVTICSCLGAMTVYLSPFLGSLYARLESTQIIMAAGRWLGFFANPNETGMAGVYGLCAVLANSLLGGDEKTLIRKYTPVLVCILGLGILLTFSRGAMVAFGAVAIFYLLTSVQLSMSSIKMMIAGAVFLLASFVFFTHGYKYVEWTPEQRRRIRSVERLLTGHKATSVDMGNRLVGANAGLAYWRKDPIFGHGLGSLHKMPYSYGRGLGCHNTHVMVLGESGVFGALFYVIFWIALLMSSWRLTNKNVRSFCLMLGLTMLLNGMVGHTMLDNRNANFMLGVGIGLLSLATSRTFVDSNQTDENLLSD